MQKNKKTAITLCDVTIGYANQSILSNINLDIPLHALCAIIGPNGSGKSTLLKSIVGLLPLQKGSITLHQKNIAYIGQKSSVDWTFPISVIDVVVMGRYSYLGFGKAPQEKDYHYALEALHQVNMLAYKDCQIGELSGGQQQRIFLARALTQNPDIFLLDEPFTGIDAHTEKLMFTIFKQLQQQNKTIIVVHHDMHAVEKHFDWVALLLHNQITSGSSKEIISTYLTSYQHPLFLMHKQHDLV